MRQWRVGTVSMGLLLLFSGIGLLYAQFNQLTVAHVALKWWPVLFVVLGIEVLVQNYLNKSPDSKIKYDIFSVFIIFLIVVTGLGIQAASEVGLVKYAQNMISMQDYSLQSPAAEIPIDKQIQRIVVECASNTAMKIHTAPSNSIQYYGTALLRAQSKEEAQNLLQQRAEVNTHLAGNILYLNLNLSGSDRLYQGSYNLVLPEGLAVEIDRGGAPLQILSGKINSDWKIQGNGETEITLPADSDLLITALTSNSTIIKGNLNWIRSGGETLPGQVRVEVNGNEMQAQVKGQGKLEISDNKAGNTQYQAKLSSGTHKLSIISDDEITINQLP
ncbi:MAG: hypothetical protein CVU90_02795 [Firmicutes bacterium HGW-Firmicutes-15]|nr:MAG: hypothetical protein CVU90_02795 [Firmicutes bacterium HGW-Firmicutes-15]